MTLTPQQKKIVKAKVQAELKDIPQAQIAKDLYPNATPESAAVMVSRELSKVNVQEAVTLALEKHGISIESATKPIADGLNATRFSGGEEGDIVPDHSIRLKASGMALKLMGADNRPAEGGTSYHFTQINNKMKSEYDD